MDLASFRAQREPAWNELERELSHSRGRPARLGAQRALALGRLYRETVADLALARRRFAGDPVVARLERLVAAGRQAIYAQRRSVPGALAGFLTTGYWRLVAEDRGALVAAVLASWLPAGLAAIWALHDPAAAVGLVPGQFRGAAQPHVHRLILGTASQATLASSIFTNNIQVSFMCFAGGLVLGLGTFAVLAFNGVLLGTLAGLTIQAGNFDVFLRYVVPHGVLELSCFAVAGAAGLRLARAILEPGNAPRGLALRAAARPAVLVVLGTSPWLVLAGLTEGFVTPHGLPLGAALAIGVGLGSLFWLLVAVRGGLGGHAAEISKAARGTSL